MKLSNTLAGAFLGAIQGVFIQPIVTFIYVWKSEFEDYFPLTQILTDLDNFLKFSYNYNAFKNAFRNRKLSVIAYSIVSPFYLIGSAALSALFLIIRVLLPGVFWLLRPISQSALGIFVGFAEGAYIGFKGGIVPSGDKKTPTYYIFDVLDTINCAKQLEYINKTICYNYLARKYHGYTLSGSGENFEYVIKDLLDIPQQAKIVKAFLQTFSSRLDAMNELPKCVSSIRKFPKFITLQQLAGCAYVLYQDQNSTNQENKIIEELFRVLFVNQYLTPQNIPIWAKPTDGNELQREKEEKISALYWESNSTGLSDTWKKVQKRLINRPNHHDIPNTNEFSVLRTNNLKIFSQQCA